MPGLPCKIDWFPVRGCIAHHFAASIDLDECIERLYKKELLAESVIEAICAKAKELLMKESNVVHIAAPVTVVGDIHGQFFDMLEIFKIGGFCPNTNYLFLGIIFDIGWYSALSLR
jgi:serine/threonine-protein phosphatase PPG1